MNTIRDLSNEEIIERIEALYPDMELSEIMKMYNVVYLDDLIEILEQDLFLEEVDLDVVVQELKETAVLGDTSCPFSM